MQPWPYTRTILFIELICTSIHEQDLQTKHRWLAPSPAICIGDLTFAPSRAGAVLHAAPRDIWRWPVHTPSTMVRPSEDAQYTLHIRVTGIKQSLKHLKLEFLKNIHMCSSKSKNFKPWVYETTGYCCSDPRLSTIFRYPWEGRTDAALNIQEHDPLHRAHRIQ